MINHTSTSFNKTLGARIKYFLINYIWKRCWFLDTDFNDYINSKAFRKIKNINYLRDITDDVFNINKIVFVVAPEEFKRLALEQKVNASLHYNINKHVLKHKHQVKIFYTENLWKNNYINNLEEIIGYKLSNESIIACTKLQKQWINVQPQVIKDYVNS